jgi:hypothetical protein
MLGDTLGDAEALGDNDGDALGLADADGLKLGLADADGLKLGLADADAEGDADALGDKLGLADALGDKLGLADALGLRLGLADALGDRLGLADGDSDALGLNDALGLRLGLADGDSDALGDKLGLSLSAIYTSLYLLYGDSFGRRRSGGRGHGLRVREHRVTEQRVRDTEPIKWAGRKIHASGHGVGSIVVDRITDVDHREGVLTALSIERHVAHPMLENLVVVHVHDNGRHNTDVLAG